MYKEKQLRDSLNIVLLKYFLVPTQTDFFISLTF